MSPNATTSAAAARKAKLLENSAKRLQAITNDAALANVDSHNLHSESSFCAPQTSTLKVTSEGGGSDSTITSPSPQSSLCYLASGSSASAAAESVAAPTPKARCTLQTAHCTLWTVHILHLAIVAAFVIRFDSVSFVLCAPKYFTFFLFAFFFFIRKKISIFLRSLTCQCLRQLLAEDVHYWRLSPIYPFITHLCWRYNTTCFTPLCGALK